MYQIFIKDYYLINYTYTTTKVVIHNWVDEVTYEIYIYIYVYSP